MRRCIALLLVVLVAGPATAAADVVVPTADASQVDVEVKAHPGRAGEAAAAVRRLGGSVHHVFGDVVAARIRPATIEGLSASPSVAWIQPATLPVTEAVTSEGAALVGADGWAAAGWSGAGVGVAVIDTGFEGAAARVAEDELPAGLAVGGYCDGGGDGSGPHGTAVAEIVYDIAPGAELTLLCIDTLAELDLAVDDAIAVGADVIVHSVGWFNTGRGDGTGLIAPMVDRARGAGILWVNSAGNYALEHWSGVVSDVDADGIGEFAAGDETNGFSLEPGDTVRVFVRWDDWDDRTTDIDVEVVRVGTGLVVASGTTTQSGLLPPVEDAAYTNGGFVSESLAIVVRSKAPGPLPPEDVDVFAIGAGSLEHAVAARSLNDISADPDAVAVGAVCAFDDGIESYSSRGPTIDGRTKPDLVGPDAVSTVSYGTSFGCPARSRIGGGFAGTSAAAPHVGAVAALLLEAYPGTSVGGLEAMLAARAVPVDPADPNITGAGRVALGLLPGTVMCDGRPAEIVGTSGPDTLTGTPGDDIIAGRGGDDLIDGGGGNDVICGGAGDDQITGGPGHDSIFGQPGNDRIEGGGGRDRILGGAGDDFIEGGLARDTLIGGPGADTIDGGAAGDFIDGGAGDDDLIGSDGRDEAWYIRAPGGVIVDLGDGTASGDGMDTLVGIERVRGSRFDDRLSGDDQENRLIGQRGDDRIDGGPADDVLIGAVGADVLFGRAGDDLLRGGHGDDTLSGGPGSDTAAPGAGFDTCVSIEVGGC